MILKEGDHLCIDEVDYTVDSFYPPDQYVLKEACRTDNYYSLSFRTKEDLEDLFVKGRLRLGKSTKLSGGTGYCAHPYMQKYVGIRDVYEYCTNCGAKKYKDWRDIKDDREY